MREAADERAVGNAEEKQTTNRFLLEVESKVIEANRRAIRAKLPSLARRDFESLSEKVAVLRADYLAAALKCDWTADHISATSIPDKRRAYEEAVTAFEALERAVKRGYVVIR